MDKYKKLWNAVFIMGLAGMFFAAGCGGTDPEISLGGVDGEIMIDPPEYELVGERPEGAPIPASEVNIQPVYFGYDSFRVDAAELGKIEEAMAFLRSNPGVVLVTEGHCDERGSGEYNMSLGEYRALAVRAEIIERGMSGSRIQTRSLGEEQPADPGHNESAWRLNRRVEFVFYR